MNALSSNVDKVISITRGQSKPYKEDAAWRDVEQMILDRDKESEGEFIDRTYYHIVRSGYYSIEKGKRLLEYYPKHTLLETVEESVTYMVEHQWFEKQK